MLKINLYLYIQIILSNFISYSYSHQVIKEINNVPELKQYLKDFPKAVIEIYTPTCPHCIDFAPKYEEIANIYKDQFVFIKIDGSEYSNYRSFVKVDGFPALFTYDNEKLFEYFGLMELEFVKQFIDNTLNYSCKEIYNENVLSQKISPYILGVFKEYDLKVMNIFKELNNNNRMFVNNCYYMVNNITNANNENNFIISNNIRTNSFFYDFDKILKYENNLFYTDMRKSLEDRYKNFILNNYIPSYEEWDNYMQYSIHARKKDMLIFSYKNEEEKTLFKSIIQDFILLKNSTYDYSLLLCDLNTVDIHYKKYLPSSIETGIYFVEMRYGNTNQINDSRAYDLENLVRFINQLNLHKLDSFFPVSTVSSGDNYIPAKIVPSLNEDKKDNSNQHHNIITEDSQSHIEKVRNPITILIYLIIYSGIFYYVYRKYFSYPVNENKYN